MLDAASAHTQETSRRLISTEAGIASQTVEDFTATHPAIIDAVALAQTMTLDPLRRLVELYARTVPVESSPDWARLCAVGLRSAWAPALDSDAAAPRSTFEHYLAVHRDSLLAWLDAP